MFYFHFSKRKRGNMSISVYRGTPLQQGSGFGGLLKPLGRSLGKALLPVAVNVGSEVAARRVKRYGRRKKGLKRAVITGIAPPTIRSTGAVVKDVIRGAKIKSALRNRGKRLVRHLLQPSKLKKAEKVLIASLDGGKQTGNKKKKKK